VRGRKPKPERAKRLNGNPGKRRIRASRLKPIKSPPVCPPWLGDEARIVWSRAVSIAPWLVAADEFKVAGFCQAMADFRWAVEAIAADGYTIDARQGKLPHPANGIKNKALVLIAKFGSDLGFDPATRARLVEPDAKPADDAEQEFFGDVTPPMRIAR
jgi:P27 family predicted phage terminase small subunit